MLPALRSRSSKLLLFNTHYSRCQFYHGDRSPFSSTQDHIPDPIPNPNPRFNEERTPEFSRRPSTRPCASEKIADFFEKFKLGFDKNDKNEKPLLDIQSGKIGTEDQAPESQMPPPQDADEIFKKMNETGLIPDAVAMVDGLCNDGLVQDAMKLLSLMREKGTIPKVVVYTAVVDAFCKAGKFDDSMRIFKKMQNNGVVPNAYTYNVLVQALCKGEEIDRALEFCLEMLEAGHSPNLTTFTGLVDHLCNKNGVEEAKTVIARLKEKGYFLHEKACKEHLEKKGPFSQLVWEAIFGIKEAKKDILMF